MLVVWAWPELRFWHFFLSRQEQDTGEREEEKGTLSVVNVMTNIYLMWV